MEIDLRHCLRCKRNTLQVHQRILTPEGQSGLSSFLRWKEKAGERPDITKEQEHYMKDIWYCPQCGKDWIECVPKPEPRHIIELKEPICMREDA